MITKLGSKEVELSESQLLEERDHRNKLTGLLNENTDQMKLLNLRIEEAFETRTDERDI